MSFLVWYFFVALESQILYIKCAFEAESIDASPMLITGKTAKLFTCLGVSSQLGQCIATTLRDPLSIFKAVRLFSPHLVNAMKPETSAVDQLTAIPFVKTSVIEELKSELPLYMAHAKDVDNSFCPLVWWKQKSDHLPAWSKEARRYS